MITVWGRRNSANVQKVMWTLGELDLAYQRHDVGGSFGFPDDYPNPNRVVPTIRDGDLTLYESNVCVRYLARQYGLGTLCPVSAADAARADQWMDWQQTSLAAFFNLFANLVRLPPEQADSSQIAANSRRCGAAFAQLDAHLAGRHFVNGASFSMADVPLGALMFRYLTLDVERPALPNLQAWYARLCERAAYQKHVMIPFGRNHAEWAVEEQRNAGIQ